MLKHVPNAHDHFIFHLHAPGDCKMQPPESIRISDANWDFQGMSLCADFPPLGVGEEGEGTTIWNINFHKGKWEKSVDLSTRFLNRVDVWANTEGALNFLPIGDAQKGIATTKGWPFKRGDALFPAISFNREFPWWRAENRDEKKRN